MFLLLLLVLLINSGSDESNIFSLDEKFSQDDTVDLLSLENLGAEGKYELNKIIKGDFLADEGEEFLLVETISGFGKQAESRFRISLAKINNENLEIVGRGTLFRGVPINASCGKIDSTGFDKAIIHWREPDGGEFIQVINPSESLSGEFSPWRAVPASRKEEVAIADMDGDGICEIVIPSLRSKKASKTDIDKIIVHFNRGEITETESYAIIPAPVLDIDVSDIDADGKDEIITLRSTEKGDSKQSIWAVKRNENGTYDEIPVVSGTQLTIAPPDLDSNRFYYITKAFASGHYYQWINTVEKKEGDFVKTNEFRILPEGLVMGMTWGKFISDDTSSLAIIMDETLAKRRWLVFYTPIINNKFLNRASIFTSDEFRPKGNSPIAYDIDRDGLDELIYISEMGRAIIFDIQTQKHTSLRIKRPSE